MARQIELHQIVGRDDAAEFERHCCGFGRGRAVSLKLYRGALFSWMFAGLCSPTPRNNSVEKWLALKAMCFSYSPIFHHDDLAITDQGLILGMTLLVFPPNEAIQKDFLFVNDPVREQIFKSEAWLRHKQRVEAYNKRLSGREHS